MLPNPTKDISFNNWIESLETREIIALLQMWNNNNNFNDDPELIKYLKDKLTSADTIKKYYDNRLRLLSILDTKSTDTVTTFPTKRYRYVGNCGRSQCEFRFNGCDHSP